VKKIFIIFVFLNINKMLIAENSSKLTGTILMPTAYRLNSTKGLNCDFLFNYIIGNLREDIRINEVPKKESLVGINFLVLGGDFKYNLLADNNYENALSVGDLIFFIWKGGSAALGRVGGEIKEKMKSFNYFYTVFSRRNIHLGLLFGDINQLFNPISTKKELNISTKKTLFLGLNLPCFKKRNLNIEFLFPLIKRDFYLLINTYITKFISFNLSLLALRTTINNEKIEGYYISGYIFDRFSLYPSLEKK
jgi:hypothetical protein